MNKIGIGIILFIILYFVGAGLILNEVDKFDNCAEDIARDICYEKGFTFYKLDNQKSNLQFDSFLCANKSREIVNINFLFLEEEIERCKNE